MRKLFLFILITIVSQSVYAGVRIIDGIKAPAGAWPATVALLRTDKLNDGNFEAQFCGGSIIAAGWVLTAAHCVEPSIGAPYRPGDITVLVNTQDLGTGGERIAISRIIRHADFDIEDIDNDLALLKLESEVSIVGLQVLSSTAPLGHDSNNANAVVTGWGDTNADNASHDRPDQLHQLNVPVIEQNKCKDAYESELLSFLDFDITDKMMCAGFKEEGRDSCYGDSGGPLMVLNPDNSGEYAQIGIVSFGKGCGVEDAYGVYTRLSKFASWIQSITDETLSLGDIPYIIGGDSKHDVPALSGINRVVTKMQAKQDDSEVLDWDLVGGDLQSFSINDGGEIKVRGPLQPGKTYELFVRVSDKHDGMDTAIIKVKAKWTGGGGLTSPLTLIFLLFLLLLRKKAS